MHLRGFRAREHQELWVPAEALEQLNAELIGEIRVIEAYFGPGFRGVIPNDGALKGKRPGEFAGVLERLQREQLLHELALNHEAIFVARWA